MEQSRRDEPAGVFAVIVTFAVAAEALGAFTALVTENARQSREIEADCLAFDVLVPEAGDADLLLYELYRTPEAFADHLTRPHFLAFDAATRGMVTQKTVTRLSRIAA